MDQKLKALAGAAWAKLKSFWTLLNADLGKLWSENKIFVIVFGAIILILKSRQLIMKVIALSAKSIFNSAVKENTVLQNQEDQNNKDANNLVNQANEIGGDQPPVSDDWYKKE